MKTRTAVTRAVFVGILIPVLVALVAVSVQIAIRPELPDPVATHWSASGPDGFSSPGFVSWMTVLVAGVLPVSFGASVLRPLRRGETGFTLALMPATAAGLSVFLGGLLTGSLLVQRGLASGGLAPDLDPVILWSLLAGAVAGALAWLVMPREATMRRSPEPAAPLQRRAGETAVWLGRTSMNPAALLVLALAAVGFGVASVVVGLRAETWAALLLLGASLLLALLIANFTVFTVRVDASGLTVRSAARLVRFHVRAVDVRSVAITEVSGLAQFGGYGLRTVPGATGVIMRSGQALEVSRRSGRRLVVTVDDAPTAAAVLAAVAEDARAAQD